VGKRIFRFSAKTIDWSLNDNAPLTKKLLGGKGASLVDMCQAGMPVPPGFTITTEVCNEYRKLNQPDALQHKLDEFVEKLMEEVMKNMAWLKEQFGYMPLVSVRSGAPISMPGMMDTILNVGLTNQNYEDWCGRIGERPTADSERRLIQMLGSTAYGVPHEVFEFQLAKVKKGFDAKSDADLTAIQLGMVTNAYLAAFMENVNEPFPMDDMEAQLAAAIVAVFDSWENPRAIEYRKLNKISDDMGTAVTVQAMVFGNMGDDSGSGVLFTRDPSTGAKGMMGEFLPNAQGEDVVAGIRTPTNIKAVYDQPEFAGSVWPDVYADLDILCDQLEATYKDMVDIEFTVQKGQLFILQSRTGKRSARAAFKIAVDLVDEKVIDKETALKRLTREQFKTVRRPSIDPKFKSKPAYVGLPACPGVVSGKPVFSAKDAVNCSEPCILVTHETTPDDIAGMAKAQGILTQTGGATSHAAVVARAMDKACVVGCTELEIEKLKLSAVKLVTIDGATGRVWVNEKVPVIDSSDAPEVRMVMDWCMEKTGTCDEAPVDLGMDRPHHVRAAYWWGNMEVFKAVLDGLAELPSRSHITLDLRSPSCFMGKDDDVLGDCFGTLLTDDYVGFKNAMVDELTKRGPALKGLNVDFVEIPALPADYAAFTVLSQ